MYIYIYINSLRLSVYDGGFGGWGPVKQRATCGDPCQSVTGCGFCDASVGFVILQSDFSGRVLYVFSRCDLESVAHDNGVLRECDSMRCGHRSIKSKNRHKKREGDADREREKKL